MGKQLEYTPDTEASERESLERNGWQLSKDGAYYTTHRECRVRFGNWTGENRDWGHCAIHETKRAGKWVYAGHVCLAEVEASHD